MALNRMQSAKGGRDCAAHRGLRNRDEVRPDPLAAASKAEVLLPPTALDHRRPSPPPSRQCPVAAAHPWPNGLTQAARVGAKPLPAVTWAQVLVVAITDGPRHRAPSRDPWASRPWIGEEPVDLKEEVIRVAGRYRPLGIKLLVIDTERKFQSAAHGKDLAEARRRQVRQLAQKPADTQAIAAIALDALNGHLKSGRAGSPGPGR